MIDIRTYRLDETQTGIINDPEDGRLLEYHIEVEDGVVLWVAIQEYDDVDNFEIPSRWIQHYILDELEVQYDEDFSDIDDNNLTSLKDVHFPDGLQALNLFSNKEG